MTSSSAGLADLYRDLHAHPELSFAEHRTAQTMARRLSDLGLSVTAGVGRTGVVGVLRNGDGPVVLLRADMDALPVREDTGLEYASTATATDPDGHEVPVMHACGHDMHLTCLLGALAGLAADRGTWAGTVLAVCQPAEEVGGGARAMVDDGLYDRVPRPDIVLGQHVVPGRAGTITYCPGAAMSAADSLRIRLYGRGGHGSRPDASIDPVVMAAATVMRLQTVVSREVAGGDPAVLTVGAIQAGAKANVIPDQAEIKVNVRTFDQGLRRRVLDAIERIVRAEAAASGAPREPEISVIDSFPLLTNDAEATEHTVRGLREEFGGGVERTHPMTASEDFGVLATSVGAPSVYWWFGGTAPDAWTRAEAAGRTAQEIPMNHSPAFAPVIEPTLGTGVRALSAAARAWLARA